MTHRSRYLRLASCLFLAVLIAVSLTCSLSVDAYYVGDEALAGQSACFRFYTYCVRSFSANQSVSFCLTLAAGAMLYYLPRLRPTVPEGVLAGLFGVLFSFMQLVGRSYTDNQSWAALLGSRFVLFRAAVVFAGRAVLSACLVLYAFRLLDRAAKAAPEHSSFSLKRFLLAAGLVALCWLPYYVLFFPGLGSPDTSMQIAWAMHYPTDWLQFSPIRGEGIYATNHHPYFTTVLFGLFAKFGLRYGNISYGVALYCLCQMLLMALALTGVWFYLRQIGLPRKYFKAGLVFTALFPLWPMYAITMVKDSLFSLACLTFSVLLFEAVRSKGESLKKNWFCILLFLNALLVMLTKNQGVYFVAAAALLSLIIFRRRLRAAAALVLPVLLFQFVWLQLLLPAWNVAPGGKQEAISLLFQQTARYVVTYPDDVTEEEADVIRAIIDYDALPELYRPTLADPVKFTYNQDATDEELSAYYHVWFQMFLRHPDAYLQALLNNIYGGFYVDHETALTYTGFDNRAGDLYPDIYVAATPRLQRLQPLIQSMFRAVQHLPGIGLLFCIGFYPWVILFVFLDTLRRRRYSDLLPELAAILSVGVLLLAPANGSYRYSMPFFFMIPFLLSICLLPRSAPPAAEEPRRDAS